MLQCHVYHNKPETSRGYAGHPKRPRPRACAKACHTDRIRKRAVNRLPRKRAERWAGRPEARTKQDSQKNTAHRGGGQRRSNGQKLAWSCCQRQFSSGWQGGGSANLPGADSAPSRACRDSPETTPRGAGGPSHSPATQLPEIQPLRKTKTWGFVRSHSGPKRRSKLTAA